MLLALILSAHATCDAKALTTALNEASPAGTGKAYAELAACDATAAKSAAATSLQKSLPGDSGNAAALAAISVGAGDAVRTWLPGLEPDERAQTLNQLGLSCDKTGVPAFFTDSVGALGDKFWSTGWYKALDDCRDPSVQEMLRTAVTTGKFDRTVYFGLLEMFSRNMGKNAIPTLQSLLSSQTDPETLAQVISAFTDAAGQDAQAIALSVQAIKTAAPALPTLAVEQARTTLVGFGAEQDADQLVTVRYKDALQSGGGLIYGVMVIETATCKKGDVRIEIHHAQVLDSGKTWPDQLVERVTPSFATSFTLGLAERCKGTGSAETRSSSAPFKDATAYKAWVTEQITEIQQKNPAIKPKELAAEPITI